MPSFKVRVCRCEHVLMSAEISLAAQSEDDARKQIQIKIDHGDDFEGYDWFTSDTSDEGELIEITDVGESL